jgi:hypothetical protein
MEHLKQVRMSYCEHFKFSFYFAYKFALGSVKALVHAVVPDCYITSTTDTLKHLQKVLDGHGK